VDSEACSPHLHFSDGNPTAPIVLIEPRDRFLFQPLLYELLSDELQSWEVAPRYDQLLNNGICWIRDSVVGVDQTSQSIELASGDRMSGSTTGAGDGIESQ